VGQHRDDEVQELVRSVSAKHRETRQSTELTIDRWFEIGREVIILKRKVRARGGNWINWVAENRQELGFGKRMAQYYRQLALNEEAIRAALKTHPVAFLEQGITIRRLLALIPLKEGHGDPPPEQPPDPEPGGPEGEEDREEEPPEYEDEISPTQAAAKREATENRVQTVNDYKSTYKLTYEQNYERVLRLARLRKNILLVGPTGCGKTFLAGRVAEELGLPFAHISCSAGMSEGHLLGRLLPTGDGGRFVYTPSEFIQRYEGGGVFLFDEIDAADSNVLIVVNAALGNDRVSVPNRTERPVARRHKDFIAIAAANTFGSGADRQYVGRNQLDEATLDRFRIGQIELDYSDEVEQEVCPDGELRTPGCRSTADGRGRGSSGGS